jgi:hypothetical protein
MRNDPDNDELLKDVLADTASDAFRAEALRQTLAAVQSRKRARRVNQALFTVALLVAAIMVAVRFQPAGRQSASILENPLLVHSRPLRPGMVVRTVSRPDMIITSSETTVSVVTTPASKKFFTLIDET